MLKPTPRSLWKRLSPASLVRRLLAPKARRFVPKLISGTAGLELLKGEHRELAPVPGMWGPVVISGNSLPEFKYVTFDERLMEFITVRAVLSLPDRVDYRAFIPIDNNPGMQVQGEWLPAYGEPFLRLAAHLSAYFPLLPPKKEVNLAL